MGSKKGRIFSEEHRKNLSLAMKGRKSWNKGKLMSVEARKKLSTARMGQHNSPETEWSKNLDSFKNKYKEKYYAIHRWVRKNKGKASYCLFAKTLYNDCSSFFDWANINGEYKKDLNDYIPLCRKHHFQQDRVI